MTESTAKELLLVATKNKGFDCLVAALEDYLSVTADRDLALAVVDAFVNEREEEDQKVWGEAFDCLREGLES